MRLQKQAQMQHERGEALRLLKSKLRLGKVGFRLQLMWSLNTIIAPAQLHPPTTET